MMKNKQLLLITIFSIVACALHAGLLQSQFTNYLYTSAFKIFIFILCPFLYCKFSKSVRFKDLLLLFSVKEKQSLKLPAILGLCVFTFIIITFVILRPFIDSYMVAEALTENSITPQNAFIVFLYIVLINAALEQFFFRGFVFMSLYRANYKRYAHIYSALLFSFYHIPILFHAVSFEILILCTVGIVVAFSPYMKYVSTVYTSQSSIIMRRCSSFSFALRSL